MISVESLTRTYGDLTAVDQVSFEINQGEIVGLLGHNGAGKTTIMKMLTGFLEPTAGRIEMHGLDLRTHRAAVQRQMGYLPENCPVYAEMTVIDYLDYTAFLHRVPETERNTRVSQAITYTELQPKAADLIGTLSRGYQQRVGVAQAILHRPTLLILDEPTNGLDPTQIQHMRELIKSLAQTATVILSTHILQEVQAVCDRVLILREGHKALDARLDELRSSRRLLLATDAAPEQAEPLLASIDAVRSVVALAVETPRPTPHPLRGHPSQEGKGTQPIPPFPHSPIPPSGDQGGWGPAGVGVEGVGPPLKEGNGERHRYALAVDGRGDPTDLAPVVARTVIQRGFKLYSLAAESRDLETIFGELSSARSANASYQ